MKTQVEFVIEEPRQFLGYCPKHRCLVIGTEPRKYSTGLPTYSCGCMGYSSPDNERPFEIEISEDSIQAILEVLPSGKE